MNKKINPQLVSIILGSLVVAAVIAAGLYLELVMAKVDEVPVVAQAYSTEVIKKELVVGGIFGKTKQLTPVKSSEPEAVKYNEEDLGKDDISHYN